MAIAMYDCVAVLTVADLKALLTRPAVVTTLGYYTAGDGGGGPSWVWKPDDVTPADDFLVVAPAGLPDGRYVRNIQYGAAVSPKWGGAGLGELDSNARFQVVLNAPGGHAVDLSGCSVFISNIDAGAASTCPGIFSDGSGRITGVAGGSNTFPFEVYRSDFYADRVFFDFPISTTPGVSPPYGSLIALYGAAGAPGDRQRVTNCRFKGGATAINFRQGSGSGDGYCTDNVISHTWGDATNVSVGRNFIFSRNIIRDCGYNPETTDSACHFSTTYSDVPCENLIVSDNIVRDCNVGFTQEAMDFYGALIRNLVISGNIVDRVGYGGFELKTVASTAMPDFYGDVLIANNIVNFLDRMIGGQPIAGIGVALNKTLDDKTRRIVIRGNQFLADAAGTHATAVNVGAQSNVEVSDNTITNLSAGIQVNPANAPSEKAKDVVIKGNNISVSGYGIYAPARTVENLTVESNHVVSTGGMPLFVGALCNNLVCLGNYLRTTAPVTNGVRLQNIQKGIFANNIVESLHAGIVIDGAPSTNLRVFRNDISSVYNGVYLQVATDSIEVFENSVNQFNAGASAIGGAAFSTAKVWGNNRNSMTANPTGVVAGALGDFVPNSNPVDGVLGWVCVTAGVNDAVVAVFQSA